MWPARSSDRADLDARLLRRHLTFLPQRLAQYNRPKQDLLQAVADLSDSRTCLVIAANAASESITAFMNS
jgi:hypothetical protein